MLAAINRAVLAAVLLGVATAFAQVASTAELEQLYLDPAAKGSLLVGDGQTLPGGTFRVSAVLQYTQGQLQSGGALLLRDRFALHLLTAIGVTDWLELSADIPVVVHQNSERPGFAPSPSGLVTPFLHAKLAILPAPSPLAVWASIGIGIPVGTVGALGNGGLVFVPRVNVGHRFTHVQLGAEAGGLIRGLGSFADASGISVVQVQRADRVGSQLYLSVGASMVNSGVRGEVSGRAFASLVGTAPGAELLFGVRYPFKDVELFILGGPGIAGAPTTPNFRVYFGVTFGR